MVNDSLDEVFHALAHRVRRDMVTRLAGAEMTVSELADPFAISLAASSKHITVLERAGLVQRTVIGRLHVCRLEASALAEAQAWVQGTERYWNERLDALARLLEQASTNDDGTEA